LLHDLPHEWENSVAAINGGFINGFIQTEGSLDTMVYCDESDIPNYWAYARQFLFMDHFFSSTIAHSLPNHIYSVAGQSGGIVRNLERPTEEGFEFPELAEFLQDAKISWKDYDGKENPKAYSLWNPLPGFKDFEGNLDLMSHLVSVEEYYRDLRNGTLPAVSWIVPNMVESEHPPSNI
jgi:phospholipase C